MGIPHARRFDSVTPVLQLSSPGVSGEKPRRPPPHKSWVMGAQKVTPGWHAPCPPRRKPHRHPRRAMGPGGGNFFWPHAGAGRTGLPKNWGTPPGGGGGGGPSSGKIRRVVPALHPRGPDASLPGPPPPHPYTPHIPAADQPRSIWSTAHPKAKILKPTPAARGPAPFPRDNGYIYDPCYTGKTGKTLRLCSKQFCR